MLHRLVKYLVLRLRTNRMPLSQYRSFDGLWRTMVSHHDGTSLTFPVDFYDFPWAANISGTTLDELVELFGPPAPVSDSRDPCPMERWAFRYECGLQLIFQLDVDNNQTRIIPDVPEIQHVALHLPFQRIRVTLISVPDFADQLELALQTHPHRQAEFDGLSIAQVWRQGDDGNQMPVDSPTSERAAKCRVAELESHKHKQIYWYTLV